MSFNPYNSSINMSDTMILQPTINIGTLGHVAHGKSTIVKAISGVATPKSSKEKRNNMTINLGYANAKIYKCDNLECPKPSCYKATGSDKPSPKCSNCTSSMTLIRHISFVDCPGHDMLMATMLNGAAVMDAALLIVAANETCPQPQTAEHLAAADIMGLKNMLVIQNKVDLVDKTSATESYRHIQKFTIQTSASNSPVIPTSAQLGINMDTLLQYIVEIIPEPVRDLTIPSRLMVLRSFDINRPGQVIIDDLKGAVIGGSLTSGTLKVGDLLEMRPGKITKDPKTGTIQYQPFFTKIISLLSEKTELKYAVPGGLIAIQTELDPSLGRNDGLVGQVVGPVGTLPDVYKEIELNYKLMRRVVGSEGKVSSFKKKEILLLNVGSLTAKGFVLSCDREKKIVCIKLDNPVCADQHQKCAVSRKVADKWRLIGWGKLMGKSKCLETVSDGKICHTVN